MKLLAKSASLCSLTLTNLCRSETARGLAHRRFDIILVQRNCLVYASRRTGEVPPSLARRRGPKMLRLKTTMWKDLSLRSVVTAFALITVAVIARAGLDPVLPGLPPFITLFPPPWHSPVSSAGHFPPPSQHSLELRPPCSSGFRRGSALPWVARPLKFPLPCSLWPVLSFCGRPPISAPAQRSQPCAPNTDARCRPRHSAWPGRQRGAH